MNWMEYGRKHSSNFRHNPGIYLEGLRKNVKDLRIVGFEADLNSVPS